MLAILTLWSALLAIGDVIRGADIRLESGLGRTYYKT